VFWPRNLFPYFFLEYLFFFPPTFGDVLSPFLPPFFFFSHPHPGDFFFYSFIFSWRLLPRLPKFWSPLFSPLVFLWKLVFFFCWLPFFPCQSLSLLLSFSSLRFQLGTFHFFLDPPPCSNFFSPLLSVLYQAPAESFFLLPPKGKLNLG